MSLIKQITFISANQSAFGTLEADSLTPVLQGDFVFGLNTQIFQPAVVSGAGATVDTNASRLRIQSGTAAAGYAYILTRKPIKYRAGQGSVVRFTPLFTAGVANNTQLWGVGSISAGTPYDGYFFGYNGTSFGIVHYIRGTPTWYTQAADWNGNKCDGSVGSAFTWDVTKGTPVMIKYPYLGFGDIFFYVQHPTTGAWVLCHTIRFANTASTTQLSNPTLHWMGFTLNSGNTTNQTMYCASFGAFVSGERSFIGSPTWTMDNNKSGITTETNLLSIQNATTYNTVANRGLIRLTSMSFSSSAAAGIAVFRLKYGVTLGGTPAYTPINGSTADNGVTITSGNSIASYDVAGTTITNGIYVFSVTVDNPNSGFVDLVPYNFFIAPAEIMTASGYSSNSSQLGVALNWVEDI